MLARVKLEGESGQDRPVTLIGNNEVWDTKVRLSIRYAGTDKQRDNRGV